MSFPLQTATQDNVLAAQVRGVLNNGPEWTSTLTGSSATTSLTAITDSTGGTAANTIAAITAPAANATTSLTDDMTAVKNGLSSVSAKVNTILTLLRNLNA
jgi:hypothetical protein